MAKEEFRNQQELTRIQVRRYADWAKGNVLEIAIESMPAQAKKRHGKE